MQSCFQRHYLYDDDCMFFCFFFAFIVGHHQVFDQGLLYMKIPLEDFLVYLFVKIIIEKLLLLQPPEHLVLPKQVPPQPVRLMHLKHEHHVSQSFTRLG